eukprot:gene60416-82665_t
MFARTCRRLRMKTRCTVPLPRGSTQGMSRSRRVRGLRLSVRVAACRGATTSKWRQVMDMLEPGKFGTAVPFKKRYGNYIGGEWVSPVDNQYFENITPVTGKVFCEVPRSTAADIDRALDAAHKAKAAWGRTSTTER